MLEFKKYSSIENSFSREFMEHVVDEMPQDLGYVVQEKVHGANTSFLCDGETVRFAKRTSMLEDGEQFYDYPELLERYKARVLKLFTDIRAKFPEVTHISVFGEMFGGLYPHDDVHATHKVSLIQKGVCNTPGHEFYGFDIYLFTEEGGRFLPVDEVNEFFETNGFFYAKTLFRGTLAECLKYPNAFQSKVAEWLGLPAIEDNICEGIVIRPVVPMYLRNGSRVLIKSKNERFAEKKSVKKRNKLFAIRRFIRFLSSSKHSMISSYSNLWLRTSIRNWRSHVRSRIMPLPSAISVAMCISRKQCIMFLES